MRLPLLVAALVAATPLAAQQGALNVALSGRATTEITFSAPRVQGQPASAPLTVRIDYGQPHARGRVVPMELQTVDTIWRTGANGATTLTSAVDLTVGGTRLPKGAYSLYTVRTAGGYQLIINGNTGQWGTEYAKDKDVARVPLTARTLGTALESMQIALAPSGKGPNGRLTITWGTLELSTDWSLAR